jgi:tRNA modification GTPase
MTDPSAPETIVAIATPAGRGGIGVVRLSGPICGSIGHALLGSLPSPRRAALRPFLDATGEQLDSGLAIWSPAPHSFTGEDVLELHAHGSPVVLDLLVAACLALGARLARPGEFSERAFLNDRMDLAQAEAIADLIDAGTATAARAALRSMEGEFSSRVRALEAALVDLRVHVEAAIDFADEELELLSDAGVSGRLEVLREGFGALVASAEQGRLLQEGATVVIAGRPNAGKSSLMNALAGRDAAIVSPTPGTTRDVLRERIDLDGLAVWLLDTAGLHQSVDPIEAEGMRRTRRELGRADHVLYIVDASDADARAALVDEVAAFADCAAVTIVLNKVDLVAVDPSPAVEVSALDGRGLDELREAIKDALGYRTGEEGILSARRRHLDALNRSQVHVTAAVMRLSTRDGTELIAEELRLAHEALGEITGRTSSDDLLGQIFSRFCIGK